MLVGFAFDIKRDIFRVWLIFLSLHVNFFQIVILMYVLYTFCFSYISLGGGGGGLVAKLYLTFATPWTIAH